MSRQSIFEKLETGIDFTEEVKRIDHLFSKSQFYLNTIGDKVELLSIEQYINKKFFLSWDHRKRCLSNLELRSKLGIDSDNYYLYNRCSLEQFLTYCEYVSNMLLLYIEKGDMTFRGFGLKELGKTLFSLFENIDSCLSELNMQRKNDSESLRCLIVEINPAATIAADGLATGTALKVFEYNHYLLKGDLDKKREILKHLAGVVEPLGKKLSSIGYGVIDENARFLLNNMNIRHNNLEGKNKNPLLEGISESELEEIYDKTYELILLCLNINNYLDNKEFIEGLKSKH